MRITFHSITWHKKRTPTHLYLLTKKTENGMEFVHQASMFSLDLVDDTVLLTIKELF